MHADHAPGTISLGAVAMVPVAAGAAAYLWSVAREHRRGRRWPLARTACFVAAVAVTSAALIGPLADRAHHDFTAHMAAHVLVGMLAPLLLVMAAPVTLALRILPLVPARRLSRLLRSAPARFLTHPVPAAVINVGSLAVLYLSSLAATLHGNELLHYLVLAHFFIAGYLFTASIAGVDPAPHRASWALRLGVLVGAIAAHGILAKQLYITPPPGITEAAAQPAAMLMFYAGDAIELALAALFCAQWYRAARPRAAALTVGAAAA